MREVRRRRTWVAGIWLVCQFSTLAAAALSGVRPVTIVNGQVCTCPPGAAHGDACPMHHSRDATSDCVLRNASSGADAVLLTLLGTPGLMPPQRAITTAVVATQTVLPVTAFTRTRSDRPESPPPRA
jgi:hypothetical protein